MNDLVIEHPDSTAIDAYVEKSYLDYALYVITDRALPHVGDGLKPVQRRIIYAMHEMGLAPDSKFKKSARTVGDVLGKYHPHGDSACYEAMVSMAQGFNYRYPLVQGQGNWGSQDDPKSFAAMRYTEAKLSKFSLPLLNEVKQGACVFVQNYDGTEREPNILPAQIPNILLNGGSGIAVGLATDIPPHNLYEVSQALHFLTENPDCSYSELMQHLPGPDQPTGATIVSSPEEIQKLYRTGHGSYRARAVWQIEKQDIVISALPHQVSGAKVIEQIAQLMQQKKLPMVEDIRDESDQNEPVRIVIALVRKRGQSLNDDAETVMQQLFVATQLENSYRVNMNVLGLNGRPQLMDIKTILNQWRTFRKETVRRRIDHRIDKIDARLHIIHGLLVAYLNLDEVIRIIREEDAPKQALMDHFSLSPVQADAILDMKLRHLAKLEEETLKAEQDNLSTERQQLAKIIETDESLTAEVLKELSRVAEEHKNSRRSPLKPQEKAEPGALKVQVPAEPITVVLSEHDWIRAGKGHQLEIQNLNYVAGDRFKQAVQCQTTDTLFALPAKGRLYNIGCHDLPSARSNGEPISTRIQLDNGQLIQHIGVIVTQEQYLATSTIGYGFVCTGESLVTNQKKGKNFINAGDGMVHSLIPMGEATHIACLSSAKRVLIFSREELPVLDKGKGNKLMNLKQDESLISVKPYTPGEELLFDVSGRKTPLKISPEVCESLIDNRAKRGKPL